MTGIDLTAVLQDRDLTVERPTAGGLTSITADWVTDVDEIMVTDTDDVLVFSYGTGYPTQLTARLRDNDLTVERQ